MLNGNCLSVVAFIMPNNERMILKMRIDKSKFSADELKQYEALIAKAVVPDDAEDTEKDKSDIEPKLKEDSSDVGKSLDTPDIVPTPEPVKEPEKPVEKASPMPDFNKMMLDRMAMLEKKFEMDEIKKSAEKYALLGEDTDKLAEMLYSLKKSDEPNYNACVAILDKQLDLVQKSGLFTEIGKSGNIGDGGSVEDKINAAAAEIQKSDPGLSRVAAIAKAWETHPELAAEYDAEYNA